MSVTRQPLDPSGSAVVSRSALARTRGPVERYSAWLVLFGSALGAVVTFHGSWAALLAAPSLGRIVAGLGLQLVLTWMQWAYYQRPGIAWTARAADALTTTLGYGPLVHGALVGWFVGGGASTAPILAGLDPAWQPGTPSAWGWAGVAAWAGIYLLSLVPAWYPESRLVR